MAQAGAAQLHSEEECKNGRRFIVRLSSRGSLLKGGTRFYKLSRCLRLTPFFFFFLNIPLILLDFMLLCLCHSEQNQFENVQELHVGLRGSSSEPGFGAAALSSSLPCD